MGKAGHAYGIDRVCPRTCWIGGVERTRIDAGRLPHPNAVHLGRQEPHSEPGPSRQRCTFAITHPCPRWTSRSCEQRQQGGGGPKARSRRGMLRPSASIARDESALTAAIRRRDAYAARRGYRACASHKLLARAPRRPRSLGSGLRPARFKPPSVSESAAYVTATAFLCPTRMGYGRAAAHYRDRRRWTGTGRTLHAVSTLARPCHAVVSREYQPCGGGAFISEGSCSSSDRSQSQVRASAHCLSPLCMAALTVHPWATRVHRTFILDNGNHRLAPSWLNRAPDPGRLCSRPGHLRMSREARASCMPPSRCRSPPIRAPRRHAFVQGQR